MATFQVWLVHALSTASPAVAAFMRSKWGWPIAESLHFIGLCLLLGAIGVFDLRLLGVAKRIPIIALHKLIPWGIGGFAVNVITGSMFLMTEPDQYVYNPSFQFKLLFIACAGLNALMFYLILYRRIGRLPHGAPAPQAARVVAAVSLIDVAGRDRVRPNDHVLSARIVRTRRPWFSRRMHPCREHETLVRGGYFEPYVKSSNSVTLSAFVHTPTLPASLNVSSSQSNAFWPSRVTVKRPA
jgi:hypothetical protein